MVQMMLQKAEVGLVIQLKKMDCDEAGQDWVERRRMGVWSFEKLSRAGAPRLGSLALRTPLTAVSTTRRERETLRVLEYILV